MTESPRNVGAITMFVEEPQRSKAFYENVFGLSPVSDDENAVAFRLENLIVNLLARPAAHELVEPGPVAAADAGSSFQLTLGVDDVDAACAELASRGVELLNGPVDRPWGLRTATFADPDGHVWELAAPLPRAEAS
jgi:catechol 2,3-dioxygenase-like lactoylglutathione lyase family enzyme